MGKLVAAFVFFLGASGLAIHEAKVPPPRDEPARPAPSVDVTPPSRAIHDDVPPWVKYAAPRAAAPSGPTIAAPSPIIITLPPPPRAVVTIDEGEIDLVDPVDRCPDQPTDNDDSDGCPEPQGLDDRIILID